MAGQIELGEDRKTDCKSQSGGEEDGEGAFDASCSFDATECGHSVSVFSKLSSDGFSNSIAKSCYYISQEGGCGEEGIVQQAAYECCQVGDDDVVSAVGGVRFPGHSFVHDVAGASEEGVGDDQAGHSTKEANAWSFPQAMDCHDGSEDQEVKYLTRITGF